MRGARTHSDIGKLLKYHREMQGLSQKQLAAKTGLRQPSISNIENGQGGSLQSVEKIMQALKLELNFSVVEAIDARGLAALID